MYFRSRFFRSRFFAAAFFGPVLPRCTDVMDASTLGLADNDPIPSDFGTRPGLTVSHLVRLAFGNSPVDPTAGVYYYGPNPAPDTYAGLTGAVFGFPLSPPQEGCTEFVFLPDAGKTVSFNDVQVGAWLGEVPVTYEIRVYEETTWTLLYSRTATLSTYESVLVSVSSALGLRFQYGSTSSEGGADTDFWNVAVNDLCVSVADTPPPPGADGYWIIRTRRRRG